MNHKVIWFTVFLAVIVANLPYITDRFIVFKLSTAKHFGYCILELLFFALFVLFIGMAFESHLGQRTPQGWEFYAIYLFLFLTLGFPGFVYRFLLRKPVSCNNT